MLTLLSQRYSRMVKREMIDQSILIGAALAAGCGIGLGWTLRGLSRSSHSDKSVTENEVSSEGEEV